MTRRFESRERPASRISLTTVAFTAAVVTILAFRFGWVLSVRVSSINMMPTLALEDRILVRGLGVTAEAGDVVLYRSPFGDALLVARVVAGAGHSVELGEDGLLVNDCPVTVQRAGPVGVEEGTCSISATSCEQPGACPVPACEAPAEAVAGGGEPDTLLTKEAVGGRCYFTRRTGALSSLLFERRLVPEGHVFVLNDNRIDERDSRIFGAIPLEAVVGVASFVYYASDETGIRWDRMNRRVS